MSKADLLVLGAVLFFSCGLLWPALLRVRDLDHKVQQNYKSHNPGQERSDPTQANEPAEIESDPDGKR